MKLTEAQLKQMILEAMGRSAHYEKLKTLMSTKEGYVQAESLYEMLRDTFDVEEQKHMDIFFEPLILARERKKLQDKYQEAYADFKAKEETFHYQDDSYYESLEQAFAKMDEIEAAQKEKDKEWGQSYVRMNRHTKKHPLESPHELPKVVTEACWEIMTGTEL